MSEMVERVARAIAQALSEGGDWHEVARSAIAAMRDLPDIIASNPYWTLNHVKGGSYSNPIPSMQAAIDALVDEALK